MQKLNTGISAHLAWKKSMLENISRYQSWLEHNQLLAPELEVQLDTYRKTLSNNGITLAFVGEVSRGKTELINALFFAGFGSRLLPSRAGRTTMCPTEILYDESRPVSLRLLPIETRLQNKSVQDYQNEPDIWHEVLLDTSDPASLAQALTSVAHIREATPDEAMELGFEPEHLDPIPGNPEGKVCVPAWRHAVLNIEHPLLKQGLRILDTPGLNVLGSEPELTLSMLPAADAIIYMLGADSGVTASDMQVWEDHIKPIHKRRPSTLFATLNKVDTLYDDLLAPEHVQVMIDDIRHTTARQLGIASNDVMPLSARQALTGRIQNNDKRLRQSSILALETLLAKELVSRQEQMINRYIVQPLVEALGNSRAVLQKRQKDLTSYQCRMTSTQKGNRYMISELTARTREMHSMHHRRLIDIKSSRRLITRQAESLNRACQSERFRHRLKKVQYEIRASLTTAGIGQAISRFFDQVYDDIYTLGTEAKLANRLVDSIYQRHQQRATGGVQLCPQPFLTKPYIQELMEVRDRANVFQKRFSTLLASQNTVARRFLSTLAIEVTELHTRMVREVTDWSKNSLHPMAQHALEKKQLLEQQLIELRTLSLNDSNREQMLERLDGLIADAEHQLAHINTLLSAIRRPVTQLAPAGTNIVPLHKMSAATA